jgi:hypothetical protein
MADAELLREFKVSASAMKSGGARRRPRTRKNYSGGDNSGALIQVSAQAEGSAYSSPGTEALTQGLSSAAQGALAANFGPGKIASWGSPQSGGNSTGAIVNLSSTRSVPGTSEPVAVTSGVSPAQPAPWQAGGKLVLGSKRKATRIALGRHNGHKKGGSDVTLLPGIPAGGTRKARKIHLRVKGVTARLHKAKKAKKMADSAPLSVIKLRLEKAGIVKKGSKAPEKMLRTMYTDLLITKKGL